MPYASLAWDERSRISAKLAFESLVVCDWDFVALAVFVDAGWFTFWAMGGTLPTLVIEVP
jgi:hypothetical protein